MDKKLPITAIIAGLNDSKWIQDFLENISFCDEIIFVDLESDDNTLEIAKSMGVVTHSHKRVPIVEIIQAEYVGQAKHNWILAIDPDERVSEELKEDIFRLFDSNNLEGIASVYVPIIFYFKKHGLKGTVWGGRNYRKMLSDKRKFTFRPVVHNGHVLTDKNAIEYRVPDEGNNVIHHYWMTSYKQFFEKHKRYIKKEVEAKSKLDNKIDVKGIIKTSLKTFRESFFRSKGYKDGFYGLFLSLFWSWYNTSIEIGIYRNQQKQRG